MGPVIKRAIPVRQHPKTRQLFPPRIFTSTCILPPKIQVGAPVPSLDEKPDVVQNGGLNASSNVRDSSVSLDLSCRIGSKVCVGGTKAGTFLFYGKTSFSDGIWCGVSLDEASGKNDGSVNGIRYFTCLAAHGVFVRPNKIEFLQSFNSGKELSTRTLPIVLQESSDLGVIPTHKMPVSSSFKRPGGSIISGKIHKLGSAQKKMGLKRRFLLEANLNTTTTIFPKETHTYSTKSSGGGAENHPHQFLKTASKLRKFQAKSPNVYMKPAKFPKLCDDLPSILDSTITINLNPTVAEPCHYSNSGDKVFILSPEQSKELSAKNECNTFVSGLHLSKRMDYEQCEAPHNLILDSTFDVTDAGKSLDSMSCRNQELFMNLSPSNTSSPLPLKGELPSNISLMDHPSELSIEPNLTFDGKLLQHSNETNTLLAWSDDDVDLQELHGISPVPLTSQTVIIEANPAEDQCLNRTFQMDNHMSHAQNMVLSAENYYPESGTNSLQTTRSITPVASLNETFCCVTKSDVSPNPNTTTVNGSSLHQPDNSLPLMDNCIEFAIEHGSCLLQENPVASTPACHSNKGQFFSTLFTPILKSKNWTDSLTQVDQSPKLPRKLTAQISTSFEESLGILSLSQMQDFTVSGSAYSFLKGDSPVSPSFCNRMFSMDDACKIKGGFPSSVLQLDTSPDCLQHRSLDKVTMQSFKNLDKDTMSTNDSRFIFTDARSKPVCQNVPEIANRNVMPISEIESSRSDHVKLPEGKVVIHPAICDVKNDKRMLVDTNMDANILAGRPLAKLNKWQLGDSLLDLSACAALKLPDDSILDLSACAAIKLPDDSLLDF